MQQSDEYKAIIEEFDDIREGVTRSNYAIDGRFLIAVRGSSVVISDLFHSKKRKLQVDITATSLTGHRVLRRTLPMEIKNLIALDLSTVLLMFTCNGSPIVHLGVGNIDFESSSMIVTQAVPVSKDFWIGRCSWISQSYPPNLTDGVVLQLKTHLQSNYYIVKMEANNQLRISGIDVSVKMDAFACFDGFIYGLICHPELYDVRAELKPLELVKVSISNDESVQNTTKNSTIAHRYMPSSMVCVGRTLFVMVYRGQPVHTIVSLDLDTLEWKKTTITTNTSGPPLSSDQKRTLVVRTEDSIETRVFRRIAFNEPNKLSNLVWLRLKRIFDARPSAYNFILSQLPANFKQKCPFTQP